MSLRIINRLPIVRLVVLVCGLATLAGCSAEARYRLNTAYQRKMEKELSGPSGDEEAEEFRFTDSQIQNVSDVLEGLFGTPDDPFFPAVYDEDGNELAVVNRDNLRMAAGRVGKDADGQEHGLFRKHCAHCHGVTGDGLGPTAAFLNPYPRDYRLGKFKFKSTPIGAKPTDDDLLRILKQGIPGTAMPSFFVLPDAELRALIDYVKYLSIRGEVERRLFMDLLEVEEGMPLWNLANKGEADSDYETGKLLVEERVVEVAGKWQEAAAKMTSVPKRPWDSHQQFEVVEDKIKRGRELFYTAQANCYSCHGDTALGDGNVSEYDDWTVDLYTKNPKPAEVREYVSLGALEPRHILPRNLRQGVYRGGLRPIDLYWRVKNGIEGTPMPAASDKLTDEDIWAIIEYVRFMPYETISQPNTTKPVNEEPKNS